MKQKEIDLVLARTTVRMRCMVAARLPVFLFLAAYMVGRYYGMAFHLPLWFLVLLVGLGSFVFPVLLIDYAEKKKWAEHLFESWITERQHHRAMMEQKIADTRSRIKGLQEDIKGSYKVKTVYPVADQPLALTFELEDEIVGNLLPRVIVNGEKGPVVRQVNGFITCYLSKAISTEKETLTMLVGKTKFEMPNPFLIIQHNEGIVWQCEGHAHERQIILSSNQMPNALNDLTYPFTLYIQSKSQGEFMGTVVGNTIVIPIKAIRKADCEGKLVTLRANFGRGVTLILPAPTKVTVLKN